MKQRCLLRVLSISFILLTATLLSLSYVHQISQAADPPVSMSKILNRSGNVVRVGEVLTFTIALTNTGLFTLTQATLVDEYDQTTLRFAWANPDGFDLDEGAGLITWTNVATPPVYPAPGLPPGESIEITVAFTATDPKTAVVNRVRVQDLVSVQGSITETTEVSGAGEAPIPNQAPVVKTVSGPDSVLRIGDPITFTQIITNDGAAALLRLPMTDTYDATVLQFNFAIPTPTTIMTGSGVGTLYWDNLVDYFGPITPFATVVVTTVFTTTAIIQDITANEVRVAGVEDEFGNNLEEAWEAQVPITIIDVPTVTPTPTPTATPAPTATPGRQDEHDDDDEDESQPNVPDTPTPAPTATPVIATPTPAVSATIQNSGITGPDAPRYLPETGRVVASTIIMMLGAGLLLLGLGWYVKGSKR